MRKITTITVSSLAHMSVLSLFRGGVRGLPIIWSLHLLMLLFSLSLGISTHFPVLRLLQYLKVNSWRLIEKHLHNSKLKRCSDHLRIQIQQNNNKNNIHYPTKGRVPNTVQFLWACISFPNHGQYRVSIT